MNNILTQYRIIFPPEHGSWSMLFVPFIIGAGAAFTVPQASMPFLGAILCLILVLAVFFVRQPVALWLRIAQGRARRSRVITARFWTAALLSFGILAGLGLLIINRQQILWLSIPALVTLMSIQFLSARIGSRQLLTELIGVMGLALSAPAAYVSIAAKLDFFTFLVWALSATHSVTSVLYVRLRISEQHHRSSQTQAFFVISAHAASLIALLISVALGWFPLLALLPSALLLMRAVYVAIKRPGIENIRCFGFTEMGLGLAFAFIVVLAFVMVR